MTMVGDAGQIPDFSNPTMRRSAAVGLHSAFGLDPSYPATSINVWQEGRSPVARRRHLLQSGKQVVIIGYAFTQPEVGQQFPEATALKETVAAAAGKITGSLASVGVISEAAAASLVVSLLAPETKPLDVQNLLKDATTVVTAIFELLDKLRGKSLSLWLTVRLDCMGLCTRVRYATPLYPYAFSGFIGTTVARSLDDMQLTRGTFCLSYGMVPLQLTKPAFGHGLYQPMGHTHGLLLLCVCAAAAKPPCTYKAPFLERPFNFSDLNFPANGTGCHASGGSAGHRCALNRVTAHPISARNSVRSAQLLSYKAHSCACHPAHDVWVSASCIHSSPSI
jgi:hypothetical protein